MRYKVKQKIFSFGDNFKIKDENDREQFIVKGKVFSFGDKLTILDNTGNEVAYIEQELFRLLPRYNIYVNGKVRATVKKEFTLFKPKFSIESNTGNYTIEGNMFAYNFKINKNGKVIAEVNKGWFRLSDTYGVDIIDNEDHGFILALVIVIDQAIHDNDNHN